METVSTYLHSTSSGFVHSLRVVNVLVRLLQDSESAAAVALATNIQEPEPEPEPKPEPEPETDSGVVQVVEPSDKTTFRLTLEPIMMLLLLGVNVSSE